jgi:hypothetical protein
MQWIRENMNAGMIRIIRERGSFVANVTRQPDDAKRTQFTQKTVRKGRFAKSVGTSIQNMAPNESLRYSGQGLPGEPVDAPSLEGRMKQEASL